MQIFSLILILLFNILYVYFLCLRNNRLWALYPRFIFLYHFPLVKFFLTFLLVISFSKVTSFGGILVSLMQILFYFILFLLWVWIYLSVLPFIEFLLQVSFNYNFRSNLSFLPEYFHQYGFRIQLLYCR